MPARLARAPRVNACSARSTERDNGAASLHIRSCCAISRVLRVPRRSADLDCDRRLQARRMFILARGSAGCSSASIAVQASCRFGVLSGRLPGRIRGLEHENRQFQGGLLSRANPSTTSSRKSCSPVRPSCSRVHLRAAHESSALAVWRFFGFAVWDLRFGFWDFFPLPSPLC